MINIPVDYLEAEELISVIDRMIMKDNNIASVHDPLTIRFVGGALVNPDALTVAIEYFHDLSLSIDFIVATGRPVVSTVSLTDLYRADLPIKFDYDDAIPEVPDSKIKILREAEFHYEGRFWNHVSGHLISLTKVTQCNEPLLAAYLNSLTETENE